MLIAVVVLQASILAILAYAVVKLRSEVHTADLEGKREVGIVVESLADRVVGGIRSEVSSLRGHVALVQGQVAGLTEQVAGVASGVGEVKGGVEGVGELVHAFLGPERERQGIATGLRAVEEEGDQSEGAALAMAEALCSRFPHSREVFDVLVGLYLPATEEGNDLLVRREAVLRLKEHADRFAEACPLEELQRAREVRADVDALADNLMDAVRREQRDRLASQVEQLSVRVDGLGGDGGPADDVLEEIGRLDNEIDKVLLGQHDDLRARYEELSNRLVQGLQEQSEDVRAYNLRALASAQEAWEVFEQGKGVIKNDFDVAGVAERLGGWDQRHLLPATSTYVSTVYAEVFQKLEPEQRMDMTKRTIEAEDRPLKA